VVANAAATGARLPQLPMTPERDQSGAEGLRLTRAGERHRADIAARCPCHLTGKMSHDPTFGWLPVSPGSIFVLAPCNGKDL
jgi:hypothetical protein